jgi:hypothetical protein
MSQLLPLQGAFLNLKQAIPQERYREYLPRDRALELLTTWTGQDFGYDVEKWECWLVENNWAVNIDGSVER